MTSEVLVHANAGENVGLGHLVRCITLTDELLARGIDTELLLKHDKGAVAFARDEGVEPSTTDPETPKEDILTASAEVVIVDSYAFSSEDFGSIAAEKTLVVVDELGDRHIPADLVLNNNIYADEIKYPAADTVLRGPEYCMLREPFQELQDPDYRQPPESLLVTVGGSDLADSFITMLQAAADVAEAATVHAIVGPYFDSPERAPENVIFHRQPPNIHELMWDADLAVSGGGQTLYELAACGTPPIALTLGPDQIRNIEGFEQAGFCLAGGEPDDPAFEDVLHEHLETLSTEFDMRRRMGETGRSLVDGQGVSRVANHIESLCR